MSTLAHIVYEALAPLPTLCIQPQRGGWIQNAGKSADAPYCLFSMTTIVFFFIMHKSRDFFISTLCIIS